MYVFSIDIPFKGSHSLAKITSNVTAVSYLHSGFNDSAVHITAESKTTNEMWADWPLVKKETNERGELMCLCLDKEWATWEAYPQKAASPGWLDYHSPNTDSLNFFSSVYVNKICESFSDWSEQFFHCHWLQCRFKWLKIWNRIDLWSSLICSCIFLPKVSVA
jgi:hypothetical protein